VLRPPAAGCGELRAPAATTHEEAGAPRKWPVCAPRQRCRASIPGDAVGALYVRVLMDKHRVAPGFSIGRVWRRGIVRFDPSGDA
jgi:hypothetical protein